MDVASIIEACGGTAAVAAKTASPPNTVAYWRKRDSIPPGRWPAIIEMAQARSQPITLDVLVQLRAGRARGRRAA